MWGARPVTGKLGGGTPLGSSIFQIAGGIVPRTCDNVPVLVLPPLGRRVCNVEYSPRAVPGIAVSHRNVQPHVSTNEENSLLPNRRNADGVVLPTPRRH